MVRYKSRAATRRRGRTWSQFAKQYVGTAAGATLGFIAADTGGAMVGGKKAWDYLKPKEDEEDDNMVPLLEAAGITPKKQMRSGKYGNKRFAKPSKKFSSPLTKYQAQGIVFNKETYGKVVSPDCVYIGHSTYDQEQISTTICLAILRKLFKKAGYDVTSTKETLPLKDDITTSEGFKFQIVVENIETGVITNYDLETVVADTLETIATRSFIATGFSFFDYINNVMKQDNAVNFTIINHCILYSKDRYGSSGGDSNYRLASSMNMKNEVMVLHSRSTLIVQNVTVGAISSNSDDTAVDAQPLKGYLYQFAGGCPSSKQRGNYGISRLGNSGLILHRAQDLIPAEDFKEPPIPALFNNCYKASNIILEPGSLKKAEVISNWRGYFNNILFGSLTTKRGPFLSFNTPGKSQMVSLEEALNTGSSNLITTTYQCEKTVGVYFITGPKPTCVAKHTEVQNSLPA